MIKRMNITKKLFIITALVFSIFIIGTLIIQSLFFESLYISKKKSDLRNNIEKFKVDYNKNFVNDNIANIIGEYEENYDIKIVIMDKSGSLKFITQLYKGRVETTRIRELTDFVKMWREDPINIMSIGKQNKPAIISTNRRDVSERKLISILPNNEKGEIIFAVSSMQPVNEAVSVIKQLYVYFFIGAILLVILLSHIYSYMIAKPLININKTATKMANLDFSEKCMVMSNDEIGNVASSLNFLSENLDNALTSLREANTRLEEDIDKERKLEKMRKEFIASVSHELKTPVTLISGYAMGLKDDIFEKEEKDFYLNVITDEAEKMGNLVSDMLDLSQMESGNFKLRREEFIVTDLLEFTIKKYTGLAGEKSVDIETKMIDNIKVYADWNRIEQVITNFITNALRHVNKGGSLKISMIDKGEEISIEFENTGNQIDEEELPKIWDKFYKIDKSRNRKLGGTGIGLSIVKNILMLHKYPFGVENTSKGVKFYFTVPK
jgi:two-component system, OmpR family, sensor histidine kinase VanS